jgi:hypothetical protein
MPVAIPDEEPIVATAALLLVHVPPVGVLLRAPVLPTHTSSIPEIVAGVAVTVTSRVIKQPVLIV